MYELKEANSLVEEFMLLANITVAAQIEKHYGQLALLRRHPDPLPTQFEPLIKAAESVGLTLEVCAHRTTNHNSHFTTLTYQNVHRLGLPRHLQIP